MTKPPTADIQRAPNDQHRILHIAYQRRTSRITQAPDCSTYSQNTQSIQTWDLGRFGTDKKTIAQEFVCDPFNISSVANSATSAPQSLLAECMKLETPLVQDSIQFCGQQCPPVFSVLFAPNIMQCMYNRTHHAAPL